MPQQNGTMHFSVSEEDVESYPVEKDDKVWFKSDIAISDTLPNPHNLPIDPVTIALCKAMGLCWIHLVEACARHEEGYTLQFFRGEEPSLLNLPANHPAVTGKDAHYYSDPEDFFGIGNGAMMLVVDRDVLWSGIRGWPPGATEYKDEGSFTIKGNYPLAKVESYKQQIENGLLLSDIINIPALEHFDIPVTRINWGEDFLTVHLDVHEARERKSHEKAA